MKKLVFTALCAVSVLALPGCFCSKEQVKSATTEEVKPAAEEAKPAEVAPEAAQPAEQAPEAPKTAEVPAK